ncbi:MAG: PduL/EutD family phosphate acyltransferase [Candidatus Diapherotrites archaeon]
MKIPIEVSARHVHLSKEDFEKLYGKNYKLISIRRLSQPREFASKEKIEIINGKEKLSLRIVGPLRENSQAEISLTDAINLKLTPLPKLRVSGDIKGATKGLIKGPRAQLKIPIIIAQRHLHCSQEQAKKMKLKDNQTVRIRVLGKRGLIFDNIVVRVKKEFKTALHLDTDEANAAGISKKVFGEITK